MSGMVKVEKQEDEKIEETVMDEEEEATDAGTEANTDDKIEEMMMKLDELREMLTELAEAVRASADATKGLNEVVQKMLLNKEIETPEEANVAAQRDRMKPGEPKPAESAEEEAEEIVEPERVQRQPDYELEGEPVEKEVKEIRKKAVTPRPEVEVKHPEDEGGFNEILKGVLTGKMTIGEINEKLKEIMLKR